MLRIGIVTTQEKPKLNMAKQAFLFSNHFQQKVCQVQYNFILPQLVLCFLKHLVIVASTTHVLLVALLVMIIIHLLCLMIP